MIRCIAIYPQHVDENYISKVNNYIKLAKTYHFDEIFTTLHLPEYSLEEQIECFDVIAKFAKENGLDLTVDIGGPFIKKLLNDKHLLNKIIDRIDFIRLDYGFNESDVLYLFQNIHNRGFVINASIYNKEEIDGIMDLFYGLSPKMKVRACHNYYLRENTGLDHSFSLMQDSYLHKYNIPIYYCVPSYSCPRGPLRLGLCTLEDHRHQSITYSLCDLYINHKLNALMMADEWLNEEEFKEIDTCLKNLSSNLDKEEKIEIEFYPDSNQKEKDIVLNKDLFRYDSNFDHIRSQSSRQMAEFATSIEPNNVFPPKAGDITIDNSRNLRYSGELQVIMKDGHQNNKTNVVAKLKHSEDLIKIWRFREGISYIFEEKQNNESYN